MIFIFQFGGPILISRIGPYYVLIILVSYVVLSINCIDRRCSANFGCLQCSEVLQWMQWSEGQLIPNVLGYVLPSVSAAHIDSEVHITNIYLYFKGYLNE